MSQNLKAIAIRIILKTKSDLNIDEKNKPHDGKNYTL